MLLERRASASADSGSGGGGSSSSSSSSSRAGRCSTPPATPEAPLTCIMYFFAAQMRQNMQPAADSDQTLQTSQTHPLDKLLAKVSTHAAFSPLIARFE